jgi:hypothetical protein
VVSDQSRTDERSFRVSPSRQEILRDFEKLIAERRLFGAARDPTIIDGSEFEPMLIRKKGKGSRFLIRKVPSRATLARRWERIFENSIAPFALFEALSAKTHEFEHRENLLLFGRRRIIYDTRIFEGNEDVGELTLSFESVRNPKLPMLAYFSGARLRVVHIEHIRLTAQRSGYASTLFRYYERLFRDLGFDQFQLNASLSVGKYYWAKEGFDFADESEIEKRRAALSALVKDRSLPVTESEIEKLNHARDFAGFKTEMRIPVYRDAEGYYSLKADERFCEEVFLPLGKALLLCSEPWKGFKTIPGDTSGTMSREP